MATRKLTSKARDERPKAQTPRAAGQPDPLPALRRMTRAQLLVVAERALTLVPRAKLPLLQDYALPPEPALLLSLCRLIDEGSDRVVFFADEAGSWQLDVDFRAMLSAYFGCLALGTPGDAFARVVDRCITAFAEHDRARLVAAAVRVGNADQRAAVKGLRGRERRG
jgi:hypothetical protein